MSSTHAPVSARLTLAAVCGPVALVAFDAIAMPLAIGSMATDLGVTLAVIAWVYVGYATAAACMPLVGGWLVERYSARTVLIWAMLIAACASVGASLAPNFATLEVFRIAQAVGFAGGLPAALAVIATRFRDDRSRVVGIWGMVGGLTAVVGQLLAGALIGATTWRTVVLIEACIAVATLVMARLITEDRTTEVTQRLPLPPLVFGTGATLCLAAAILTTSRANVGPGLPAIIGAFALLFAALTWITLRRRSSGILSRMQLWQLRLNSVSVVLFAMSYVGILVALPLALGSRFTSVGIALLLTPAVLVSAVLQPLGGKWAQQHGHVKTAVLGYVAMISGLLLLVLSGGLETWALLLGVTVASAGVGIANPVLIDAAIAYSPTELKPMSGAVVLTIRQLGLAMGAAVIFAATKASSTGNDVTNGLVLVLVFALGGLGVYVMLGLLERRLAGQ